MYRVTLACDGVPINLGSQAAIDIAEEFSRRPWHTNVTCTWRDGQLVLQADNDFDSTGEALSDEFSDAICACLPPFDGNNINLSVLRISTP